MQLKTHVWIIVVATVLGLALMGALGLYNMRQGMLEDRRVHISQLLDFAGAQLNYYHRLEQEGKLSQEEAQRQAKEIIGAQRKGNDYFFVRSISNDVLLVHPISSRVGKVDDGGKLENGRRVVDIYREALSANKGGQIILSVASPRPGAADKKLYPKLNGITEFEPWGWAIGTGFFVDDIDAKFWNQSIVFLVIGGALLAFIAGLVLWMRNNILKLLGGEPRAAAECMRKIANGDLGVDVPLKNEDNHSLMASLNRLVKNPQPQAQQGLAG